ncbi:MAG: hypothetical protein ACKPKO_44340, partial [Candidatus Fonsibacter sp.]
IIIQIHKYIYLLEQRQPTITSLTNISINQLICNNFEPTTVNKIKLYLGIPLHIHYYQALHLMSTLMLVFINIYGLRTASNQVMIMEMVYSIRHSY